MNRRQKKRLDRSLEVTFPAGPRKKLEAFLSRSAEARLHLEQRRKMREMIAASAEHVFAPGFAERTLRKWADGQVAVTPRDAILRTYRTAFNRIVFVAGVLTAILLIINLMGGDVVPRRELLYASDLTIARILRAPLF